MKWMMLQTKRRENLRNDVQSWEENIEIVFYYLYICINNYTYIIVTGIITCSFIYIW